jgi:hypothetical protein
MPGAGFKKIARQYREQLNEATDKPYHFVKHMMAQGKFEVSFVSQLLENGDSTPEEKRRNKWASLSLYAAGADTVSNPHLYLEARLLIFDSSGLLQRFRPSFGP